MLNRIVIMGRIVRDLELRHTQSGIPTTSFTLAVDRDFKGQGGEKETDFIDVVAWRQTAEFVCKYFSKGRMAVVEGSLQICGWTDKNGNKRRNAEVLASNVYFGDSKVSNNESKEYANKGQQNQTRPNYDIFPSEDEGFDFDGMEMQDFM